MPPNQFHEYVHNFSALDDFIKTYGITATTRDKIVLFAGHLRGMVEKHLSEILRDKAMIKMAQIDKDLALRKPESALTLMQSKPSIYQAQERIEIETLKNVAQTFSKNVEY